MNIRVLGLGGGLAILLVWGCSDAVPTSGEGGLVPIGTETVEIRLSFAEFADSLQQLSGYSSASRLPGAVVSRAWQGDLDTHTAVRFGAPIDRIFVIPPGSPNQTTVADLNYVPIGGRLVVFFDLDELSGVPPIEFEGGAIQAPWHVESATWDLAVDTLGDRAHWPEPGGGPVTPLEGGSWAGPTEGDSVVFQVDSLLARRWIDPSRPENGVRISVNQAGSRVRIVDVGLMYRVRSSIADTIVEIPALSSEKTLLYSPDPAPFEGAFRVGGAPAHRAAIHFDLPESADGDAEVCSLVPCPVELRADRLVYAGLQLYSRGGSPAGLLPLDTIGIDMRPVLSPEHLPRSPLGATVQSIPTFLDPGIFAPGEETLVELPMTRYVRDLLREPDSGGDQVPSVLALLTGFEPWALEPATFWGVGSELEPVLRLVLTVSDGLSLP